MVWIQEQLPRPEVVQLLSHATVFVCPSRYEPFGLVNIEAMGCAVAVVATDTGGIPEIVVDGETGYLVEPGPDFVACSWPSGSTPWCAIPTPPGVSAPPGRQRVLDHFTWPAIAAQTVALYRKLLG